MTEPVDNASSADIAPALSDPEDTAPETLSDLIDEQDTQTQEYAVEFLKKIIRIRGVRIDREAFLSQELRKLGVGDDAISDALTTTPVQAGLPLSQLDRLASGSIDFETRKSAAMSFAAGLPGGFTMFATVPADVTQYYVHAFRVMQKLAYIYGWKDFLGDLDDADDETIGKVAIFLGVMMGVSGASASLTRFAQQIARPAIQHQITKQALTKTAWYPVVKQTLKLVGVKVTKDSFAKTVTKAVPVAGGVISGGMTIISLNGQSVRLQKHLRELPPPGADAQEYLSSLALLDASKQDHGGLADARALSRQAVQDTTSEVRGAATRAASTTKDAAGGVASRAKGATSALLRKGLRRLEIDEANSEVPPADNQQG